jgi:biotin synthase-related radical SAM superfamily protein
MAMHWLPRQPTKKISAVFAIEHKGIRRKRSGAFVATVAGIFGQRLSLSAGNCVADCALIGLAQSQTAASVLARGGVDFVDVSAADG